MCARQLLATGALAMSIGINASTTAKADEGGVSSSASALRSGTSFRSEILRVT
jgi:hypothetical protein